MNITFNSQNTNIKTNNSRQINFEGVRQLIGSETVKAFIKHTKIIGDVVINKRTGRFSTTPVTVSLAKTSLSKKGDKDSKIVFSLFEKGFEKAKTVAELDAKELGLVEVKYKNLSNVVPPSDNDNFSRSIKDLLKNYNEGVKVLYLVSHEGDKYQGIGSKLLDAVVAFSQKLGVDNKVFLHSKNHIPDEYLKQNSAYFSRRLGQAPTNFYYNYGFISDAATNREFDYSVSKTKFDDVFMRLPKKFKRAKDETILAMKKLMD